MARKTNNVIKIFFVFTIGSMVSTFVASWKGILDIKWCLSVTLFFTVFIFLYIIQYIVT